MVSQNEEYSIETNTKIFYWTPVENFEWADFPTLIFWEVKVVAYPHGYNGVLWITGIEFEW